MNKPSVSVIAISNQKGGVGKTTTAITLGHGLALHGKRVLLVDLDPQGHCAWCLGMDKAEGVYRLLVQADRDVVLEGRGADDEGMPASGRLDLIPSDKRTSEARQWVAGQMFPVEVLAERLEPYLAEYDAVIIDTAPSLDVLQVGAFWFADLVIVCTNLDAMSLDGVAEASRSIAEVSKRRRVKVNWRVVPTMFDRVTKETRLQFEDLREKAGPLLWPAIPRDVAVREANSHRRTLWEYAPRCTAVVGWGNGGERYGGYADLLSRVLESI